MICFTTQRMLMDTVPDVQQNMIFIRLEYELIQEIKQSISFQLR